MIVRAEGVSFAYAASSVLRDVSLDLPDGRISVAIGPSGSGKSTLLHLLAGLRSPDQGRVVFDGRDVTGVPTEKRDVGVVFQSYALFPHMTVRENVSFGLRTPRCRLAPSEAQKRVRDMLRLLDLETLADRRPDALSGGERQRVALARAVAPRPSLLLLDEPLSALDARLRASVRFGLAKLLRELAITTLYVTHDQQEAMLLADHLIVLNGGRVEQAGDALTLYRRPTNLFVASFLGETNLLKARVVGRSAPGDRRVRSAIGEVSCPLNGLPEGSPGKLLLRPEDLHPAASGASARVTEARGLGAFDRVMAELVSGEQLLLHLAPGTAPAVGQALSLTVNPGRGHFLAEAFV